MQGRCPCTPPKGLRPFGNPLSAPFSRRRGWGFSLECGRIFLQLFLTIHGYASLLANNPIPYNENEADLLLGSAFTSACAAKTITKEDQA